MISAATQVSALEDLTLPLDAFIRSAGLKRSTSHALFIGAGSSVSSGVPSAERCVWEWKRNIFVTNNPGLDDQFSELSLPSVQQRIQAWLDRQRRYPTNGSPDEYGFYIQECFPISGDRRAYFQEKIRSAKPHIGYHLLCHLAQAGFFRSAWSPNFDGLPARAAAGFQLTPLEVGIDCQQRLSRPPTKGEILCVSLHGDYRYDPLKNTPDELREQEKELQKALTDELKNTPLIVTGYSGRDRSIMDTLRAAYSVPGTGSLYWCGFSDDDVPSHIADLIRHARASGRDAFYVHSLGFDDLMTRLALHCLVGEARERARGSIFQMVPPDLLSRSPFQIASRHTTTLIKSNAFEMECPSEVFQFDLKTWPEEKVWSWLRAQTSGHSVVAVPLKGKVLAIGLLDDIKKVFGENIKGPIERTPIAPDEYRYEDSAVSNLMRTALVQTMAKSIGVESDGREEIWFPETLKTIGSGPARCVVHESLHVSLRRNGNTLYAVLMPSVKVLDSAGKAVSHEVSDPIKLNILGWQHNKEFNEALNKWRKKLFPDKSARTFEFPPDCGSSFSFKVHRSPVFAEICKEGDPAISPPDSIKHLLAYRGIALDEPRLLFSNRQGTNSIKDTHPIRGMLTNRPYDFPLTLRGLLPSIRLAIVCPQAEANALATYLAQAQRSHRPAQSERDYLLDYPGFQTAYGLPLEVPRPGATGWALCPEPTETDPRRAAVQIARHVNECIQSLQSSCAANLVLVFFPDRWNHWRGYRTEDERFDVHDFVKAFCVQKGIATQFLNQSTLADSQQCRVWWWLSLALYVKAMRTPWVLDNVADDTAFVGLGFSLDMTAGRGKHVVLGCSHIYSNRGEGLQYRLSKIEDPIIRGGNPFMSGDDARRVGETIRELFWDGRNRLPRRVVLHKRTPFRKEEREGLLDGLGGIEEIDMLEIQFDHATRYVASRTDRNGKLSEDNYPVRRGTAVQVDTYTALLWVHGAAEANNPRMTYFQGKRRIPAPLTVRRHVGHTDLTQISEEILGLSKMNWNTFDLYTKHPATLQSSGEIARIGSLLRRFGSSSYDYRLFI